MKPLTPFIILMFLPVLLFAHGDNHKHKKKDTLIQEGTVADAIRQVEHDLSNDHPENHEMNKLPTPDSVEEFPSFHPLVVHFPIVFLLIAFILQGVVIILNRKEFNLLVFALALAGFAGAFIAARNVHPHTAELSSGSAALLEKHELFATYTLWLSGFALIAKAFSFFYKKKVMEWLVGIIMMFAAVCVSFAGHHGAELVHKFGIGPKGEYLETNHDY